MQLLKGTYADKSCYTYLYILTIIIISDCSVENIDKKCPMTMIALIDKYITVLCNQQEVCLSITSAWFSTTVLHLLIENPISKQGFSQ